MNKLICNRGHYYDRDRFASCPHCKENGDQWMNATSDNNENYWNADDGGTQTLPIDGYETDRNMPEWNRQAAIGNETVSINDGDGPTVGIYPPVSPQNAAPQQGGWNTPGGTANAIDWGRYGDGPTVGIYPPVRSKSEPVNLGPVAGWLICIEGKNRGRDYRINVGNNTIGRSTDNSIALIGDEKVSREQHAIIVYDPRSNAFYALPGKARGLSYVNGKVILEVTELKKNDILELGDSKLMLIPCCDEKFNWNMVYDK